MNPPRISVITVVRDGMPFVEQTMDSVLAQDHPSVEYWVVDGGSTDGTLEAIHRRASRLAGWVSEPDAGIADAFNKGLARATGDYVMFLNADDALASPNALSGLLAHAAKAGWPQVIYGDCDLIERDTGRVLYRASIDYDRRRFLNFAMLPHPGMLVHKDYFARHGNFDTSFRMAMDYELLLRGVPEVGAVRAPLLVTRVRTGGASTRDPMRVVDENLRALRKNGRLDSRARELGIRAYYRLRFAARAMAEALGLYRPAGSR